MSFVPITPNIVFIQPISGGRFPYSNSLLIQDKKTVLIDTGLDSNLIEKISNDYQVDLVINSHCHEDHIAGNDYFPNSTICAHHLDAPVIRSINKLISLYGMSTPNLQSYMIKLIQQLSLHDSRVDIEFEDGKQFDLGTVSLQVLHTPGHSPGHCCFLIPEENLIFLADIDLTSFGPWYGALNSVLEDFITSIEQLITMRFDIALTSHKIDVFKDYTVIRAKLNQYLNRIIQREEKLLTILEDEHSLEEIVNHAIVYRKFPKPVENYRHMESIIMQKHLTRLITKEKVKQTEKGYELC